MIQMEKDMILKENIGITSKTLTLSMTILSITGLLITMFSYELFVFRDLKYKDNWDLKHANYLSYISYGCTLLTIIIYPLVFYLEIKIDFINSNKTL